MSSVKVLNTADSMRCNWLESVDFATPNSVASSVNVMRRGTSQYPSLEATSNTSRWRGVRRREPVLRVERRR